MVPGSMELGGVRGCGLLVSKAQTNEQRHCILRVAMAMMTSLAVM